MWMNENHYPHYRYIELEYMYIEYTLNAHWMDIKYSREIKDDLNILNFSEDLK